MVTLFSLNETKKSFLYQGVIIYTPCLYDTSTAIHTWKREQHRRNVSNIIIKHGKIIETPAFAMRLTIAEDFLFNWTDD